MHNITLENLGVINKKNDEWKYTPVQELLNLQFSNILNKQIEINLIDNDEKSLHTEGGNNTSVITNEIQININSKERSNLLLNLVDSKDSLIVNKIKINSLKNSQAQIIILQNEKSDCWKKTDIVIDAEENSEIELIFITIGGKWSRTNLQTVYKKNNVKLNISGLYTTNENGYIENQLQIEHASNKCETILNFKGLISKNSMATFGGKVTVNEGTIDTVVKMNNANLLADNTAISNSLPAFKINSSDILCTHGCTTGHIDDEQLFYLQARGINKNEARKMLRLSFIEEIFEKIQSEKFQASLKEEVITFLEKNNDKF